MDLQVVTRTIQFMLAPVVMVSTCAIVLGGSLGRYAFLNDRLRSLAQERRALLLDEDGGTPPPARPDLGPGMQIQRRREIEAQVPSLLRRHTLLRDSLTAINYATIVFFADMFVIALAALVTDASWINILALAIFLAGTGVVAFGVLLSTIEIRTSHLAVEHDIPWALGHPDT